jgi:uncharacterized protein (DUF1330 family)
MIRHVIMGNFKAEITPEWREKFITKAQEALSQVPGTHNVRMGKASEIQGKNPYELALFIDFDDEAAFKAYQHHPLHNTVAEQIPAVLGEVARFNFDLLS